jgi:AraC-like DNA-binding protein
VTNIRLYKSDLLELAFASPAEWLRPYVREYAGWIDRTRRKVCRRQVPTGQVALIINFDESVRERKAGDSAWRELRSFTAGLHDAFTLAESTGPNRGTQVDFTPVGARLFYNQPLEPLANRSVALPDVLGPSIEALESKLFEARSWEAHFRLLDEEISARILRAKPVAPEIVMASQILSRSDGRVRIDEIVRDVGWSERHFATQFRTQLGLSPKVYARVLRFGRAVRVLSNKAEPTLADVALSCGYYDQAHFTRDIQHFAGIAPLALVRERPPSLRAD